MPFSQVSVDITHRLALPVCLLDEAIVTLSRRKAKAV
jgi:hypothetical protein